MFGYQEKYAISIHAPRGGSDNLSMCEMFNYFYFNPRSPRGERLAIALAMETPPEFQSTLPAGGATPNGERPFLPLLIISIHAPRGGSDCILLTKLLRSKSFQSTLPAGGATPRHTVSLPYWRFQSTLPAGGATILRAMRGYGNEFQSTLPAGGATRIISKRRYVCGFQSTLPAGGATKNETHGGRLSGISIHAPRGGSDGLSDPPRYSGRYFNPRSPRGERRAASA